MKLTKFALAVLLGAASMAAAAADNSSSQSSVDSGALPSADGTAKKHASQSLQILQPKLGATITDATTVKAVLRVGDGIHPKSLRVTLNGKNVSSHLQKEECNENACRWTVELTKANRLLAGQNQFVAFARGSDHSIKMAQAHFGYYYGLRTGENQPQWLPPTVGLSLKPGGAQPWVTLTTGFPANMQDNLDPTQKSLPYRDATFPTAKDTACTTPYQVVVLNRLTPAVEDAYWCVNDSASLKSQLATLTKGTEIVLVGTTQNSNADAGLDTTSIGGTNYSTYPAAWQPQEYAAIGVSGAAAGSAYESYYLAGDVGKAYQTSPFANGLLAEDGNSNYNFHAGDNLQFEVYPNNPIFSSNTATINYGNSSLTWLPPSGSTNGIWLLVLDRVTLLPADVTSQGPCQIGGFYCGTFYPTGSTDPTVAAQAVSNLTQALGQPTNRQLIVFTTVGQPFQSGINPGGLVAAVKLLGGPGYLLPQLTPTSTYALIAPGIAGATSTASLTPFSTGVVNSSSAFSQQGQTGIVRGVMALGNQGLYFPTVVSQEDGKANGPGATTLSIDYDFYTISTQPPIDWPLTDTAGHMAAYHWASLQFLSNHYGDTGDLNEDVRYWYHTPTRSSDMATHNTDFLCPNAVTNSPCDYPGESFGFTEQDLADVDAELYRELTALHDTDLYLGPSGIGGLMTGGDALSDQVITAASEVLNGQVGAVQSTSVSASSFDWMNLLAGVTSMAGAALGPLDLPIAAAAIGVTSGGLWTGSALSPWAQGDSATPPSYENGFDTTLGQLQQNETTYAYNLAQSYGTSLNNIYSDWGKLSATGAKTADSSTGWYFDNQLSALALGAKLQDGVRRSMYLQLLPQFYSLDTYSQQPIVDIDKLGTFYSWYNAPASAYMNQCNASYPAPPTSRGWWAHYANPSGTGTDIDVMGGVINNQNSKSVSEPLPSDQLLNTLFGQPTGEETPTTEPLNIPYDLVHGTSTLPSRQGPSQGTYDGISQCYQPGCQDETYESSPSHSKCIAP